MTCVCVCEKEEVYFDFHRAADGPVGIFEHLMVTDHVNERGFSDARIALNGMHSKKSMSL